MHYHDGHNGLKREHTQHWSVDDAFAYCEKMAREHYENFPVASRLIPKEYRRHVAAIYAFARTADDFADEGDRSVDERLAALDDWHNLLRRAAEGDGDGPIFTALAATLDQTGMPVSLLEDLLTAFRRDAVNQGYEMESELFDYCRYSANPVGRLVLYLFGYAEPELIVLSDHICTGLQLVNFWQDLSADLPRGRQNIPREAMRRFAYTERELENRIDNDNFRKLMSYLTDIAEDCLGLGSALPRRIPSFRLRLEMMITILGGLRVAEKIREMDYHLLTERPKLGAMDWLRIGWRVVLSLRR